METSPRAPASVVAAGVVAIIGGAFVAVSMLLSLFVFSRVTFPANAPAIPTEIRPLAAGALLFFFACGGLVVVTGVFAILLRNWARIALLVIAGCSLFFGVIGIGVIFFALFVTPAEPGVSKPLLAAVLSFIYGVPVCVALWWLILFTRRPIVGLFEARAVPAEERAASPVASLFNNPRCPLAIRIVGWYLASFLLFLPILPFLPVRIPAVLFARVFRGPAAFFLYFAIFILMSVPGVGLLLARRWSFPLAVAGQLLTILNVVVTVLSPTFETTIISAVGDMGLPAALPQSTEALLQHMRYINLLGTVIPVAILVVLFLFRRPFYAATHSVENLSNS